MYKIGFGSKLLSFVLVAGMCLGCFTANAALKRGVTDDEVRRIQVELLRRGYRITEIDGIFGPETEAAVKLFQYHNDLNNDGVVDVKTYLALFSRKSNYDVSFDSRRLIALDAAISMLGTPYVFGGGNRRGIDCSAFTQRAYACAGVDIPRTADIQYEYGRKLKQSQVQAGDLVFYTTYEPGASHCGIYMGNGKFIHSGSSTGVTVADAFTGYWGQRYYGACRVAN